MKSRRDIEGEKVLIDCAPEIAKSTAAIAGYDVIITNVRGIIIGASRAERLGCHHEASDEVVATGQASSTTAEQAQGLQGTLPGVTYPIVAMNGVLVGTMAITGDPAVVRPFALIVQKQIEILLREKELFAGAVNRENTLQNLVQEMVSFVRGVGDEPTLAARATMFGYDPEWRYLPLSLDLYQFGRVAARIRDNGREEAEQEIQRLKNVVLLELRRTFRDQRTLSAGGMGGRYAVFWPLEAAAAFPKPDRLVSALTRCHELLERLESLGLKAAIGVGEPASSIADLAVGYRQACKAMTLGKKFHRGPGVYRIADFSVEELIAALERFDRSRFAAPFTAPLRGQSDWEDLRATVRAWCESGFSLVTAAKGLSVHRNTLLYRLEKIERLTGREPRNFRAMLELYLALMIDEYDGPAQKE